MAACFCRGGPDCCIHRDTEAEMYRKVAEALNEARRRDTRKRCMAYCGDACICGAKKEEAMFRRLVGDPLAGLLDDVTP